MAKRFLSGTKTLAKNLVRHTQNVLTGQESVREALGGIKRDSQKLTHTVTNGTSKSGGNKRAEQLVKKGRDRYNAKDYDAAERLFREALTEDARHVWAMTYLGHTLYQQGRANEAVVAWQHAHNTDPASEAGIKALKKIRHVERGQESTVRDLEERLHQ